MILEVAFEMVGKAENVEQEGIYRQNGNMNLILGLKLVKPKPKSSALKSNIVKLIQQQGGRGKGSCGYAEGGGQCPPPHWPRQNVLQVSIFFMLLHCRTLSNSLFSRDLKEPLISEGLLMKLSTFVEVNKVLIWNLVTKVFWRIALT